MNTRLGSVAALAAVLPLVAAACGDSSTSADTLPPMITTTTSTTIPATTTSVVSLYTVQSGDTLSKIARKFGVDKAALMLANHITNPDHIEKGAVLTIPPPTTAAPAVSTLAPGTTG